MTRQKGLSIEIHVDFLCRMSYTATGVMTIFVYMALLHNLHLTRRKTHPYCVLLLHLRGMTFGIYVWWKGFAAKHDTVHWDTAQLCGDLIKNHKSIWIPFLKVCTCDLQCNSTYDPFGIFRKNITISWQLSFKTLV